MSLSSHQQMRPNKNTLESAQSRLALLSYLTEKKDSASFFKKKSFFWDQEHLYSENLTLRSQIKQLTDANTKAKTRILEMEAQLKSNEIKGYEQGYKQTVLRSMSLRNLSRKSLILSRPKPEEENRTKTMRQIVRQLRDEITTLKNENSTLKRNMKYTRMSQLQAMNTEMEIELQRLSSVASEAKNKYYALVLEFDAMRNHMKRQNDTKKLAIQQKTKLQGQLFRLQKEKEQVEKKSEQHQRQLRQEIKKAKTMNPQISYMQIKPSSQLNSIPKLEYSISGLERFDGDTINFDKLINTDSELKSIPKIASITSLELLQKQNSTKHDLSPQPASRAKESEVETPEEDYQEDYEFEQDDKLSQAEKKEEHNLPLQTAEKVKVVQKESEFKSPQPPKHQEQEQIEYNSFQEEEFEDSQEVQEEVKQVEKLELKKKTQKKAQLPVQEYEQEQEIVKIEEVKKKEQKPEVKKEEVNNAANKQEVKSVEVKSVEVKSVEVKSVEVKNVEVKKAEVKKAEVKKAEVNQDEVNQEEVNQEEVNQEEVNQDEVNQEKVKQEKVKQAEVNKKLKLEEEVKSEEVKVEGKKEEAKIVEGKKEEVKIEVLKKEELKKEEAKIEGVKKEQAKKEVRIEEKKEVKPEIHEEVKTTKNEMPKQVKQELVEDEDSYYEDLLEEVGEDEV